MGRVFAAAVGLGMGRGLRVGDGVIGGVDVTPLSLGVSSNKDLGNCLSSGFDSGG